MNLLSSKLFNLLFITISCIILLPSCTSDDDVDVNGKFRSKYSGTYWETNYDGIDLVIKFSEDKLFSYTDGLDSECYFYEEGSKNNVDYDGCIYHKITDVILEEDSEKLIFLEMYTSGTPTSPGQNCDGGEFTVTFQTLGENAISMIIDYGEDFGSDTFTLIKSSSTFSSNNCSNANSSGYLLLF
tara:strand:+ start:234 stop:788 length:555 start_codon:yes stop_codon:yes gene_type:complete